jgi:anti-sigma regulatory factor (Ser/Thr protein kinase)
MVPPEGLDDDVAIVAMQSTSIPEELLLDLLADPSVLSGTRRLLRRWLRDRGADEPILSEVALATNEACANAIEHAYAPGPASFQLHARVEPADGTKPDTIVLIVTDSGQWRPPRGENRGRGLTIIETAMDDFEINTSDAGTEIVMRRRLERR